MPIQFGINSQVEPLTTKFSNGLSLNSAISSGKWSGIQDVAINGIQLRNNFIPILPWIRTPDGVESVDFEILDHEVDPKNCCWVLRPWVRSGGLQEWMLHEVRPRLNTTDWQDAPRPLVDSSLALNISETERSVGGRKGSGFVYQYKYHSPSAPIYRLLDRASWEPGGSAAGLELIQRHGPTPRMRIKDSGSHYSTEWYLSGNINCNVFQFKPFQTGMEGFTFTVSSEGVLITWATRVAHIRTLIEKPYDQDSVLHWHEHCDDLKEAFETSPMEVLWFPGKFTEADIANLYVNMLELVSTQLHEQIGMRRERIKPYGQIEEWGPADLRNYAEKGVPKLTAAGMKIIGLANHFENNMNLYGVSNMCCTVSYEISKSVGKENLKLLCETAKENGAKVDMWGNTAISTIHPLLYPDNGKNGALSFSDASKNMSKELALAGDSDLFIRNPSGAIESDHYAPSFACFNLRHEAFRNYWLKKWKALHDDIGVEGIFLDSSFNLSSDKFHWRSESGDVSTKGSTIDQTHLLGRMRPNIRIPAVILSQYKAHLSLMVEMQKLGYIYLGEDVGVFGLHRSGVSATKRADNLWMWVDGYSTFNPEELKVAGYDPDEIFFRGIALRLMWNVNWNILEDRLCFSASHQAVKHESCVPSDWHISLYKAFNEVEADLINPQILPEFRGIVYAHGTTRVLWSFEDFEFNFEEHSHVTDILSATTSSPKALKARRHKIYRITPA